MTISGPPGDQLLPRRAAKALREALADTRVVLVNGARQGGKSTLVQQIAADLPQADWRSLDDPAVLRAARADPTGFVQSEGTLVIDEIQRAPELLLPIKARVDRRPRQPGQFILTGSAQVFGLKTVTDGNWTGCAIH